MGPVSKRDLWLVGIAGFLAVNLVVAFHFYDVGKRNVALKSTRDSLAVVVARSKDLEAERDVLADGVHELMKRSDSSRVVYAHDKSRVALKGDTAVTKDSSQVLLPEVAAKLRDDDAHIANLEAENASLRLMIGVDSTLIRNQAEQIRLNQNIAKMVQGPSHFSHGVQAGGGYCLGGDGIRRPCIYVGYGVEVRL
jgi:hypothetical protein